MALAGRRFRVILVGMVAALLMAGGLAASASAQEDRDCAEFKTQEDAQAELRAKPSDPNGLDGNDDDGIACESLPPPRDEVPVQGAIGTGEDSDPPSSSSSQYQYDNDGDQQQQQQQEQVINIPNKPLPNTGGFPPLLAAGFFLVAGAGLLTALLRRRF